MNYNRLLILFLLQKARQNKQGKCPLRCRITFNKKRKEFSTGFFINPDYWNSKKQKAIPSNNENDFINTQISLIIQKVNQAFLFLQVSQQVFDVEDVYLQYRGKNVKSRKTLLEVFELHNVRMKMLIGKGYTKSTYSKFIEAKNHTSNFIKNQYNKSDMLLEN